jgi:hypothetical protein
MLTVGPVTRAGRLRTSMPYRSADMMARRCLLANARALPLFTDTALRNTTWG